MQTLNLTLLSDEELQRYVYKITKTVLCNIFYTLLLFLKPIHVTDTTTRIEKRIG